MDLQRGCCPSWDCSGRGRSGRGSLSIHSQQDGRYWCSACEMASRERQSTPSHRCRTEPAVITMMLTWIAYGCPPLAVEKAFSFQARAARRWLGISGRTAGPRMRTGS